MAKYTTREKSEFDQKLIDLRRVARVMAGGRRFNFRATIILGNHLGLVGFGIGKGADTALSIEKAVRQAKKNMMNVPLTPDFSIPHEVSAKFKTARVVLKPAKSGKGLVAGGSVRSVLALVGVKNASAKILSHTKNKLTNARAALEALKQLKQKQR